jgi:hypothetical protein
MGYAHGLFLGKAQQALGGQRQRRGFVPRLGATPQGHPSAEGAAHRDLASIPHIAFIIRDAVLLQKLAVLLGE